MTNATDMPYRWFRSDAGGERLVLTLHVQPGAKRSEVAGPHGDALKIKLAAPPVEGVANATLLAFFAEIFNVPVIVLAVKPQQLSAVARALAPLLTNHLVISIAAGIQTMDISRWLGDYVHVVRAMPNTPALILAGVTGLYAMSGVTDEERDDAETILSAVGTTLWVSSEELLHAVTAVSGSGPAYIFYFIEAMQKAGQELGLDAAQARRLSIETFLGAARLADESGEDAALLRTRVASPGGTTERAITSMENDKVGNAIRRAIHASNLRSREMSAEFGKT